MVKEIFSSLPQALIAKSKMLGNIKFIGELGKLNMLHERILHQCVKQLLEKKKDTPTTPAAEAADHKAADQEVCCLDVFSVPFRSANSLIL